MAKKQERRTIAANSLGPVDRMGDRARLAERALASAKAKAQAAAKAAVPSESVKAPAASKPSRKPAYKRAQAAFVSAPAPAAGGAKVRRGKPFVAGSTADMAYTGIKAAKPASVAAKAAPVAAEAMAHRPPRMGTGIVGGAVTLAAAAAGMAIHDKTRARKAKRKGK